MKIATVIGTRPEIIKMAPILDLLEKKGINNILIHTGQHYDHEMSQQFFMDLELKKPDYNIGVGSNSQGNQTADMIKSLEEILIDEKLVPLIAVLVLIASPPVFIIASVPTRCKKLGSVALVLVKLGLMLIELVSNAALAAAAAAL